MIDAIRARAAGARRRVGAAAGELRPPQRTAVRIPAGRRSPLRTELARCGEGSWVVPPVEIVGAERIEIGTGVVVLELGTLACGPEGRIVIGDGTRLARGVSVISTCEVVIGPDVSTSDYVAITDTYGPIPGAPPRGPGAVPPPPAAPVRIERGAYLGCNSAVGPGVVVGEGAYVGEGAVVVDDVAPHTVVYGNPARVVRRLDPSGAWTGARFG